MFVLYLIVQPGSPLAEGGRRVCCARLSGYYACHRGSATITGGLVLAEGLMMAAVLSDTHWQALSLTAPRSTAAELRFCSTRYQVCLNFQLELELTGFVVLATTGKCA